MEMISSKLEGKTMIDEAACVTNIIFDIKWTEYLELTKKVEYNINIPNIEVRDIIFNEIEQFNVINHIEVVSSPSNTTLQTAFRICGGEQYAILTHLNNAYKTSGYSINKFGFVYNYKHHQRVDFIFDSNSSVKCIIDDKTAYTLRHQFSIKGLMKVENEPIQRDWNLGRPMNGMFKLKHDVYWNTSRRVELFNNQLYFIDKNDVLVRVNVQSCYDSIQAIKQV